MKTILLIIATLITLACFGLAYLMVSDRNLRREDLELRRGVLVADPSFSRDEYDQYNTSMRLKLEGEKAPLGVPGKLLEVADERILQLKAGDQVQFHAKKKSAYTPADRLLVSTRRLAYSLQSEEVVYYTTEDSLALFKGKKRWVYAIAFLAIGVLGIYFLFRR